jgi:hypothetical protein
MGGGGRHLVKNIQMQMQFRVERERFRQKRG